MLSDDLQKKKKKTMSSTVVSLLSRTKRPKKMYYGPYSVRFVSRSDPHVRKISKNKKLGGKRQKKKNKKKIARETISSPSDCH